MKPRRWIISGIVAVCCLAFSSAYGQNEEIKGYIIERTADMMTIRNTEGTNYSVVLTDDTKVQMPKGLGLRHKQVSWTELIPGLRVSVKGRTNATGQFVASQVSFNKDDLQHATMIQAGIVQTQKQVETNQQDIAANRQGIEANRQQIATVEEETNRRFAALADYDVKQQTIVYFNTGSSTISARDKAALCQLATNAAQFPAYLIQVQGYADSTGNQAINQKLSRNRAEAVVDYLMQGCSVTPRHIVAPGAMGISNPVASNETAKGRAENRRVEVKILVNKGVAGSS